MGRVRRDCLPGLHGLLCLLTADTPYAPGIDRLDGSVRASQTAIVGCVGCLTSTHLVGVLCPIKRSFPGGPSGICVCGSGLVCPVQPVRIGVRSIHRSFFCGRLLGSGGLGRNKGGTRFLIGKVRGFEVRRGVGIGGGPSLCCTVSGIRMKRNGVVPL